MSNKFNFTDNKIRTIQPIADQKRGYHYDTKTAGLRLQVTASGTKSFQFQAWDAKRGRPATRTLGKYPAISINKARELALRAMTALSDGVDIENEAQRLRDEDTLNTVFERWLDQFAIPHKKSWSEDVRRYDLYIKKPLGNKRVSWFSAAKIRTWHNKITTIPKQRGEGTITQSTANRALALLSTVFNQSLPEIPNPCRSVKKFHEESRDRFLQPDELKRFFEALHHDDTPETLRDYILISLFTGARRANNLSMMWNEISFERGAWIIPAKKSKNGSTMVVPLVEEALEILQKRKQQTRSVFVFPGPGKTGHYLEPKRAWKTLITRANLQDIRLHDLRRTMGSWQTMTGASSTIVGKTLGHKSPEATAVYARLNLDPVRASMAVAVKAMLANQLASEKIEPIRECELQPPKKRYDTDLA
ncbi:tyrosine-type recombinase/integrase [Desulfofustis glycolicus]|uniref:Site-specific recombinase XerD n=1 Tax=Desulfofustis glycolicus DSM 9705 TaxID=1121409 RepID=A0A1M5ULH5_9BACT|nr:site-specific integrase [Desulfofustis glycolicus]SHH63553.1 Site-specific recombinase XerD [Desulfofustis glycolicus DSM 9705]